MRILVLGGTAEAFDLVCALSRRPGSAVTLSLAGRTSRPREAPAPAVTRSGGFGGTDGLAAWLRAEGCDLLVDATHPFAAIISRNAATAAEAAGIPLLALRRPPWTRWDGDRWTEVDTLAEAGRALEEVAGGRRILVTVGRQELGPFFATAPRRRAYLVRSVEPAALATPGVEVIPILDRGPFAEEDERALMGREGVAALVTKNAGGMATYGKIAAARALGLPVIMVRRPMKPEIAPQVATAAEAVAWIEAHCAASKAALAAGPA
jgi:precorrin-6A/cobalt-precorrin-6A reductase